MQKIKSAIIPWVSFNTFEEIEDKYGTRFSKYKFKQSSAFINYAKFSISCLGPQLWNRILLEIERNISNLLIFKIRVKEKFLSTDNELDYF